jgi:hypothetical protein
MITLPIVSPVSKFNSHNSLEAHSDSSGGNSPASRSDKCSTASTGRSWSPSSTIATDLNETQPQLSLANSTMPFHCIFSSLGCHESFQSGNLEMWRVHCTAHIGPGIGVLRTLDCFICSDFTARPIMDEIPAWNLILDHVASAHPEFPQTVRLESENIIIAKMLQERVIKLSATTGFCSNGRPESPVHWLQDSNSETSENPSAKAGDDDR